MNQKTCNFGEHLTIDGYQGNYQKLNDKNLVLNCLDELPELIGVKKLSKAEVFFAPDTHGKDPGG